MIKAFVSRITWSVRFVAASLEENSFTTLKFRRKIPYPTNTAGQTLWWFLTLEYTSVITKKNREVFCKDRVVLLPCSSSHPDPILLAGGKRQMKQLDVYVHSAKQIKAEIKGSTRFFCKYVGYSYVCFCKVTGLVFNCFHRAIRAFWAVARRHILEP